MSERTCEGCRWFRCTDNEQDVFGECRRFPPLHSQNTAWLAVRREEWCGEWQDATITPEQQAERRELVRRFALAITEGWYASANNIGPDFPADAWKRAEAIVDAEGQQ